MEENTNFHCIVCNAEFLSRTERNEHLETHFVHRNCGNCRRQVIVIGDLEFELHQPTYCKPNELIDDERTELIDIYETNDDNHLSDDESLHKFMDAKSFDEQQNSPVRLVEAESDGNNEAAAIESDTGSVSKILKLDRDQKYKPNILKRALNRTCKNVSQSNKKLEPAHDSRPANSDSDDDVLKQMDVATIKRRRKYRKLPKTVPCTNCDSMFGTERTLKIHMNQVHGIKERYICPICSREFKIGGNLKQHIETHSDYKRYVCNYCGKGFHLPYNLKEHMNTHTGAR